MAYRKTLGRKDLATDLSSSPGRCDLSRPTLASLAQPSPAQPLSPPGSSSSSPSLSFMVTRNAKLCTSGESPLPTRGLQTFSVKGERGNIWGFAGPVASVATARLCCCEGTAATDHSERASMAVPTRLRVPKEEFHAVFTPQALFLL